MKALCWIIGCFVITLVIGLCGPVRSEGSGHDHAIADAILRTTTIVDGEPRVYASLPLQRNELAAALTLPPADVGGRSKVRRDVRCYYNCPPPVGSVTASPQVVRVPTGAFGVVTLHWRWDQSSTQVVAQHSCLWVSRSEENEAHLVQCEHPGHTYATTLKWVGAENYIFRVAPGNPTGPFTRPVAGLFQLAQTIVVGAAL
jgi:hypothetical protein